MSTFINFLYSPKNIIYQNFWDEFLLFALFKFKTVKKNLNQTLYSIQKGLDNSHSAVHAEQYLLSVQLFFVLLLLELVIFPW